MHSFEKKDPRLTKNVQNFEKPCTPRYVLGYKDLGDDVISQSRFKNLLPPGMEKPAILEMKKLFSLMRGGYTWQVNSEWMKKMLNWDLCTHPQEE